MPLAFFHYVLCIAYLLSFISKLFLFSFHRTGLYQYQSDDRSSTALLNYVLKGYVNDEAGTVPPPHDHK